MLKFIIHGIAIAFLTVLTQVGGIVYLIVLALSNRYQLNLLKSSGLFLGTYMVVCLLILPFLAPMFGRVALPVTGNLKPLNYITCLLNRHYVRTELREQLVGVSDRINKQFEGTKTNYLDANFPFYDGFPLFPHLSHNDGRKVDIAFYYTNQETKAYSNSAPSFIGYGIYEGPAANETNYPKQCADKGYWQYGFLNYLIPHWKADKFSVDVKRTGTLIRSLATDQRTSKIFLEPHLKQRWKLGGYNKIRFHGCQAVRHDDHIHLQL
ncbi:hypothetical protein FNH22_10880 [Fulvivirga sp. M361]|uniref:hypothetical protein n=1 Tax=Fulvivirga sp. M361 TaxID=2594266 RepID=UPI00117B156B|nr:hypothetical protein [Fulvivirga sp. M361]TRX59026.1 hypothetical protein FNH22_10880 [Fulvivirga sp. M361]